MKWVDEPTMRFIWGAVLPPALKSDLLLAIGVVQKGLTWSFGKSIKGRRTIRSTKSLLGLEAEVESPGVAKLGTVHAVVWGRCQDSSLSRAMNVVSRCKFTLHVPVLQMAVAEVRIDALPEVVLDLSGVRQIADSAVGS